MSSLTKKEWERKKSKEIWQKVKLENPELSKKEQKRLKSKLFFDARNLKYPSAPKSERNANRNERRRRLRKRRRSLKVQKHLNEITRAKELKRIKDESSGNLMSNEKINGYIDNNPEPKSHYFGEPADKNYSKWRLKLKRK